MKRKVIKIIEEKCTGCGLCVNACAEGAIALVNGKAKLVSETYCDGLGACIGKCPYDAIVMEEREAEAFDPEAVKRHLGKKELHHGGSVAHGCPGMKVFDFSSRKKEKKTEEHDIASELSQWPIQLHLVPAKAPYWNGADLLLAADCTAFAFGAFHSKFLSGKKVIIACPKLDETEGYAEKLTSIIRHNNIKSITAVRMEVPCCGGIANFAGEALRMSGKKIPFRIVIVGIDGSIKSDTEVQI